MPMKIIVSLIEKIGNHPGLSIILTAIIAWLVYRIGVWNERKSVLRAIQAELDESHQYWLRTSWPESRREEITGFKAFVFKIETTAINGAISRGGSLFLNNNLINVLVGYKQAISNLNQLIESSHQFQSNVELWDENEQSEGIKNRGIELQQRLHISGIGDSDKGAAHSKYQNVRTEINKEKNSKALPIIWLLTGLSFFRLKEFICKYL